VSIELVENEIRRFLATEEPEVICISGHWGIGKTFAWNRYLKDAQTKGTIALKRYSYVSLFGVNSLDEFKYSIFENSVRSEDIGIEPSLETLQSNTSAAAERLGRKSLWFLQQIPLVKTYVGGLGPVWFLSVRQTIICVDDVERLGKGLSVRDVLGLISNLKERKGCKICLILNDEAIEGDPKKEFGTYFEKVVDTSLKFAPSAQESVRIALAGGTKAQTLLSECCVKLGISNIRLIKKIERSVSRIEPMLEKFDEQVMTQAVQSLALFGWSVFEPTVAPSTEYLQKKRGLSYLAVDKDKVIPEREAAWNALLDSYRFTRMDEFDQVLLEGVRNGFFDSALVEKYGLELDRRIKAGELDSSFWRAWDMIHDSFDNNQEEVLDAIYEALMRGIQYVIPPNLSATVKLFKDLGRPDQAAGMIREYVEKRGENRELFNLNSYPFSGDVTDPDVVRAFRDKYATFAKARDATAILQSMASAGGWNVEDIPALSSLPVEEYYNVFKKNRGDSLHKMLDACLQFDRVGNATPEMSEISKRAKEALARIGRESAINAVRVRRYGITIPRQEGEDGRISNAAPEPEL
jgi:hypothetical protein